VGSGEVLVFDTGPLSHCARENCLWVLKAVVGVGEVKFVSALADDLLAGEYRLPIGPGGFEEFEEWATDNGLPP
jgi:hypothetical protein